MSGGHGGSHGGGSHGGGHGGSSGHKSSGGSHGGAAAVGGTLLGAVLLFGTGLISNYLDLKRVREIPLALLPGAERSAEVELDKYELSKQFVIHGRHMPRFARDLGVEFVIELADGSKWLSRNGLPPNGPVKGNPSLLLYDRFRLAAEDRAIGNPIVTVYIAIPDSKPAGVKQTPSGSVSIAKAQTPSP